MTFKIEFSVVNLRRAGFHSVHGKYTVLTAKKLPGYSFSKYNLLITNHWVISQASLWPRGSGLELEPSNQWWKMVGWRHLAELTFHKHCHSLSWIYSESQLQTPQRKRLCVQTVMMAREREPWRLTEPDWTSSQSRGNQAGGEKALPNLNLRANSQAPLSHQSKPPISKSEYPTLMCSEARKSTTKIPGIQLCACYNPQTAFSLGLSIQQQLGHGHSLW